MDMNSFIGSRFLGATDYPRPVVLTIEQVNEELLGEDKKRKSILFFEHVEKALVLNKTNIAILIDIMGTAESDKWMGQQVEIYTDPNVMYAGKRMPGLRLRAPQPRAAALQRTPQVAAQQAQQEQPMVQQPRPGMAPANAVTDEEEPDRIPDPGEPIRTAQRNRNAF